VRKALASWARLIVSIYALGAAGRVQAQASLPVLLAQPKQLRIDGDLAEWRGARFVRLGSDDAGRSEVALAHDAQGLYVAARVYDDSFVRSAHPGPSEDALVVTLALPAGPSFATHELWLFAGRIGQSAASLQLRAAGSKPLHPVGHGAQIVEGPLATGTGYVVEAWLPWSALPQGNDWSYARGAARLHDVDRAGRPGHAVPPDAQLQTGARLPWLLFEGGPVEALAGFFANKNLASTRPLLDWVGDVRGDARAERVVVVGTFVLRSGTDANYTFADLPATRAADVRAAEMIDLTGDGKPELVVRLRAQQPSGESEQWRVFDVSAEAIQSRLSLETRKQIKRGTIEANVTVAAGRPPQITVRAGAVHGVSAEDYVQTSAPDVVAIPVPWGAWLERVYAWDGQHFTLRKERANPAATTTAAGGETPAAPTTGASGATRVVPNLEASQPRVTEAELLQAYRTARAIPAQQTGRFAQHANVAADTRPEALTVFGRDLVVVGEGFRSGRDFFFFTLPARQDSDVLQLFSGDVTGDGRADVLARIRQQIGSVTREIIYVYGFTAESILPLLAVEVRRVEGSHSITNSVALVSAGTHMALRVQPGVARGWSASDYPFAADSHDGVAPLLLPWMDKTTDYKYDGKQLTARVSND
jgi:hypothetical protein